MKVTKASVHYGTATDSKRCDGCSMSTFPDGKTTGTCSLVIGPIAVNGTCDKWEAK